MVSPYNPRSVWQLSNAVDAFQPTQGLRYARGARYVSVAIAAGCARAATCLAQQIALLCWRSRFLFRPTLDGRVAFSFVV